uniref:Peroxisomal membrane protein 11C n=1 Tax=Lygus hesperus TaxID=30085 RepID=A0A146KQA3_LYGHE
MESLKNLAEYLESYSGRDKVMRILYYAAQYAAGRTSTPEVQDKLNEFSDQINSCRTVLRLFDDIPMLYYTLSYGLGKKEPEKFLSFCGVAVNALDQLYYPVEHIAWAADCKLLPFKSDRWWTASSICWALSMYLMVLKSLRHHRIIQNIRKNIAQMRGVSQENIHALSTLQKNEMLTAIRCLLDLVHAVHWLPYGFLWAGKLKQWHIGILGILSSLISLCQS